MLEPRLEDGPQARLAGLQLGRARRNAVLQSLVEFAQLLFGCALFGNIGVDPHPFDDRAAGVQGGNRPDREGAPRAIRAANAMLEHERATFGDRGAPGLDGGLSIVRMHRVGPAVALVFVVTLAGERRPARLLAFHSTGGVIGPKHALDRIDGGAEPGLAGLQRHGDGMGLGRVGAQHEDGGDLAGEVQNRLQHDVQIVQPRGLAWRRGQPDRHAPAGIGLAAFEHGVENVVDHRNLDVRQGLANRQSHDVPLAD